MVILNMFHDPSINFNPNPMHVVEPWDEAEVLGENPWGEHANSTLKDYRGPWDGFEPAIVVRC